MGKFNTYIEVFGLYLRKTRYITIGIMILLLVSCSTTKNLPEGQVLYTGQKKLQVENESKTETGKEAMNEVRAALAKAPNNSLFGSSTTRHPFAFGLWIYNGFVNSESGLGRWIFRRFAAKPVYISTVNPELRSRVASNLLRDYGYFNGTVDFEVIPNERNDKKAKIQFTANMGKPYFLDSISYRRFTPEAMELINARRSGTYLHKGDQFSVINLENERQRLNNMFRNRGYYYFRPDYMAYRADTTRVSGLVDLQMVPKAGIPANALRKWHIGDVSVHISDVYGQPPNDSIEYKDITIYFRDKLKVRPEVLYKRFRMDEGQLYAQWRSSLTQERFTQLGIFRYTEMQFTPRDSTAINNIIDLSVRTAMDLPYDSQFEFNLATKSNDYAGPGIVYSITKRNVFRGGETFSIALRGSYEWQTKSSGNSDNKINSYELGINSSLTFPRIVFPWLGKDDYDYPATTTFSVNADLLNRAHFFRMLSFGGDATYVFEPTYVSRHRITPFKLTYNVLSNQSDEFREIMDDNPALYQSMRDQFIPSMSYTYTYDDIRVRRRNNHFWWESSLTSAGNLTSGIYSLFGKKFSEEKRLFGSVYSQFLKLTSEARYTWNIDRNQSLAMRLMGGVIYPYGNTTVAPYSEQFFVGGANSIRAFTVRAIGPGRFIPKNNRYSYLDQVGDIKLEANIEYRFRIIKNLHGAVFMDTGNIWLIREDPDRPRGKFTLKDFGNNLALGTGAGLRYDLTYLVVRLDCGIGLHVPYETGKSGYYNLPSFKDGLGWHLAIGYPF